MLLIRTKDTGIYLNSSNNILNILHMTPDFNYGDGRSYYVSLLIKYSGKAGLNLFLLTNGGDSIERAVENRIKVYEDKSLSRKTGFIKSLKNLRNIAEENKIDIIHTHHRYYELLANSASAFFKGKIKTAATALSLVEGKYYVEFKSDKIIAVSKAVKKMLTEKYSIDEKKIELIPNFTDSEEVKGLTSHSNKKKFNRAVKINLLCVGRLHKEKDQLTLLRAIKISGRDKFRLTLVGEGNLETALKNYAVENKLDVEFVKSCRDLSPYYIKSDICVLPSRRDPFPGFMLQSGLYGKPFIGADTDGISELIQHNKNGLLFRKGNAEDLSNAILNFMINDELRLKCAGNLHNEVLKNYTEKKIIPRIITLYENLIKK